VPPDWGSAPENGAACTVRAIDRNHLSQRPLRVGGSPAHEGVMIWRRSMLSPKEAIGVLRRVHFRTNLRCAKELRIAAGQPAAG
jgi:hypothetical protein